MYTLCIHALILKVASYQELVGYTQHQPANTKQVCPELVSPRVTCGDGMIHGCCSVQNRMSSDFVKEVEGVLGEHEGDLELNQQKSPRPREEAPRFPAPALLDIISDGIQVSHDTPYTESDRWHVSPGASTSVDFGAVVHVGIT